MATPKILILPGSMRAGSPNVKLAALAAKELAMIDIDVTRISLEDYPLPLFDGDLEDDSSPPVNAAKLKQMITAHHGVFITSPEYSASVTPLLKNAIDWVSRVRERGIAYLLRGEQSGQACQPEIPLGRLTPCPVDGVRPR